MSTGILTPRYDGSETRVGHRRPHIFVSEELLHSTDVISIFKKMSGKRVTKCVAEVLSIYNVQET